MKIAIIGHGNVGGTLAGKWAKKGHQVIIGIRKENDEKAQNLARQENISVAPIPEAVKAADVLLVAVPAEEATDVAETIGEVSGKVLIDATNSIRNEPGPYSTAFEAFKAMTDAEIVKCFNTTGYENMEDPVYEGIAIDMFMAGDSRRAKEVAGRLAEDAGFAVCYDFDGDGQVKALENLAYAWINLAIFQKQGRNIAFKVLRRKRKV